MFRTPSETGKNWLICLIYQKQIQTFEIIINLEVKHYDKKKHVHRTYVRSSNAGKRIRNSNGSSTQTAPKQNVTQEAKKEAGTAKTTGNKKQDQKAAGQEDKEKKETSLYGTIFKIDKEKMELKTAAVIWEKEEQKADAKPDTKKTDDATEKKDTKAADKADQKETKADFETDAMKWKLDGKSVVVKFDKDTKFLKQVKKADDKKDQKTEKTADVKADAKTDAVKMENESIKLEDLKEGTIVTVNVKEDGSLVAAEVLVLADVKENKEEVTKDAASEASKETASNKDAVKKDAGSTITNKAGTAKDQKKAK